LPYLSVYQCARIPESFEFTNIPITCSAQLPNGQTGPDDRGGGESTVAPKTKVQTILKIYAYNVTN